jgi:hypothetical protein
MWKIVDISFDGSVSPVEFFEDADLTTGGPGAGWINLLTLPNLVIDEYFGSSEPDHPRYSIYWRE